MDIWLRGVRSMSRTMPSAGKNCSVLEWLALLIVYIVHQGVVIALGERCRKKPDFQYLFPIRECFTTSAVA
jgi:hypothetical protein